MDAPGGVLAAYAQAFTKAHPSAVIEPPDKVERIGHPAGGDAWRAEDGWGEYYFFEPASGPVQYVAMKMPDVMAYDVAEKFRGKIDVKELGMGDAAWDAAVVRALGGEATAKMSTETVTEKAEWTAAAINDLPDSSFAYIEPGGTKDEGGKTTPRSLRHLPYKGPDGSVDMPHLRAALSRASQVSLPASTKAKIQAKLQAVADKHGVGSGTEQKKLVVVPEAKDMSGSVKWPVMPRPGFRGSSLTGAGEKAPNQKGAKDEGLDLTDEDFEKAYEEFRQQVAAAVKSAAGPGSRVQSLIFAKDKYPSAKEAKSWASDHSFKSGKVDETGESFRIRQADPGAFDHMRTISLTEGVSAVIGFPKQAVKAVTEAFFLTNSGRLAFKSEELAKSTFDAVSEEDGFTVYRVSYAGKSYHFAEAGGSAAPVNGWQHEALLNKAVMVYKAAGGKDAQRYTLSVVYPASKREKPEPDFHGDVMSEEELEKSAWGFMGKGQDRIGLMHRPGTGGAGKVVESYIWRGPEWKMKDAGGMDQSVSPGDWVMGIVWSPEAWQAIQSGQLTGLSLQGAARKEAF